MSTPLPSIAPSFFLDIIKSFEIQAGKCQENKSNSYHNRKWRTDITGDGDKLIRLRPDSFGYVDDDATFFFEACSLELANIRTCRIF